jgi:hypothetical protein
VEYIIRMDIQGEWIFPCLCSVIHVRKKKCIELVIDGWISIFQVDRWGISVKRTSNIKNCILEICVCKV